MSRDAVGASPCLTRLRNCCSDVSPDVRSICRSFCALVKEVMPEAVEFVYHGAVNYSLSESPFDRICYIAPYWRHANLGFSFGAHLSDPRGSSWGKAYECDM